MVKKTLILIIIFLWGQSLTACNWFSINNEVHNNDWSYKLPNKYEINHINSREIICGKRETEHSSSIIIDRYVTEFCFSNQFVSLKCVDVPQDLSEEINRSDPDYYIIDTVNNATYGPFDERRYSEEIEELNVTGLSAWVKTYPRPEGAVFT